MSTKYVRLLASESSTYSALQTIEKYRLPIFSNITLSLSGIDDLARRSQINSLLTHLGGKYVMNLERPVKVTHLLCSGDEETDKMKYAEKFNKRGEAQIWLVWEEWFWDSIEFGGRFQEEKYVVGRPRPERKLVTDGESLYFIYLLIVSLSYC
jgi:DNA replication regulator DPB11